MTTLFNEFKRTVLDGKLVPLELYIQDELLTLEEDMTANNTPTTTSTAPAVSSDPAGFSKYDISTEQYRTYHYSNGSTYTVKNPKTLFTKNVKGWVDTHRIVDVDGLTHCPTKGWINISWYAPSEPVSF
jgi:hypothetical protein